MSSAFLTRLSLLSLLVCGTLWLAGCELIETDDDPVAESDGTEQEPPPTDSEPNFAFSEGTYPMEATSQGGGTVYRDANNEISVAIPFVSLDSLILVSGDSTAVGPDITLAPTGMSVELSAYALQPDGSRRFLRSRTFPVIQPPIPEIKIRDSRGQEITNGDAISRARPVVDFQIEPDREFATAFPNDARYRIQRATVALRRGLAASETLGTFSLSGGSTLRLIQQLRTAQGGDLLLVRLEGVVRINANGQANPVNLSESTRSYTFILS